MDHAAWLEQTGDFAENAHDATLDSVTEDGIVVDAVLRMIEKQMRDINSREVHGDFERGKLEALSGLWDFILAKQIKT